MVSSLGGIDSGIIRIHLLLYRYDALSHHIRSSALVRKWFANHALLSPPSRLGEYILMAPSPDVRTVFVKLVVFFCHFAINDEPLTGYDGANLCEQVLISVLRLLKSEAADYGKHLPHYFSLFSMYVGLGTREKQQLLRVRTIYNKIACHSKRLCSFAAQCAAAVYSGGVG